MAQQKLILFDTTSHNTHSLSPSENTVVTTPPKARELIIDGSICEFVEQICMTGISAAFRKAIEAVPAPLIASRQAAVGAQHVQELLVLIILVRSPVATRHLKEQA